MGLFDIFKQKNKSNTKIEFKEEVYNSSNYDSWEQTPIPRNDNYAIAAFINMSQSGKAIGKANDDYPRYCNYRYGINNPISFHKKIIKEGFLIPADVSISLNTLKVEDLKNILRKYELSDKGKKAILIERIKDNIDITNLNLETYFVPSKKGIEHLNKYGYCLNLDKFNISFEQFENFKKKCHQSSKPNDIIWRLLNTRFNEYNINGNFSLARNELYYMYQLLDSENKKTDALYYLILVLYYDTSGCTVERMKSINELQPAPGIIREIYKKKIHYDKKMLEKCFRHDLPKRYISQKNFEILLQDIFEDKSIDITKYIRKK